MLAKNSGVSLFGAYRFMSLVDMSDMLISKAITLPFWSLCSPVILYSKFSLKSIATPLEFDE